MSLLFFMRKDLYKLFLFLLLCFSFTAQAADFSRWTPYLSYYDGKEAVRDGRYLYALMGENLLVCDLVARTTTPITRISHGLASKSIAHIALSHKQKTLVLLYADGNVDLLRLQTGKVVHLPHLANYQQQELMVDRLRVQDDDAFITTNAGFLWVDVAQALVRGHFAVGSCHDVARWGDHLFVATGGKLQRIGVRQNLNDKSLWQNVLTHEVSAVVASSTGLYVVAPASLGTTSGIWRAQTTDATTVKTYAAALTASDFRQIDTRFTGNQLHRDAEGRIVAQQQGEVFTLTDEASTATRIALPTEAQYAETDGQGGWWIGFNDNGFVRRPADAVDWTIEKASQRFGKFGPRYDLAYFMRYRGEDLLIACGRLDPLDAISYPQMAEIYDGKSWTFLESPTAAAGYVGAQFENATCIDRNPLNPQQYAVTTSRTGLYLYNGSSITKQYTYTNSALVSAEKSNEAAFKNYVRTDGAIYDPQGNLFLLNNSADTALHVITPKGVWGKIYLKDIDNAPTLEKTMFDSKGRLWILSRRTAADYNSGFLCLDYNGTPTNTRDDVATFRSSFPNQDGENITFNFATSIAEDRDSAIWLGTNQGLFRVDNPNTWNRRDFYVTQVKVPRKDGSNLADYLLAGANISAIAVDGANRKWVGTLDNGLYLLSPDALTVEEHFTTANSPLFSNEIWSIACHPTSGEVMIGTSAGLLSYQARVSTPAATLESSNIRVYPNPVRPDYVGNITLDGLVADAEVRVVSADGRLVARGMSLGGTFTWDGRTMQGTRAASGVYYFYVAAQGGTQSVVAKVAFVR